MIPSKLKSAEEMPPDAQEWFYVLIYEAFKFNIITYEYNQRTYLPFKEVMGNMRVFYEEKSPGIITGFFVKEDSTYQVNINEGYVQRGEKRIHLDKNEFIATQLEVYVTAKLFADLFDINVNIYNTKLEIRIESENELPLMSGYNRYRKYQKKSGENDEREWGPLIADRKRNILNGGMLDYKLNGNQRHNTRDYSYETNLKLEVLGGDLQYRSSGMINENSGQHYRIDNYDWTFSFLENSYINHFKAGHITDQFNRQSIVQGLNFNTPMLFGALITNETYRSEQLFDEFIFNEPVGKYWQIELYKDNQLYTQTISDEEGKYKLSVPINYGATDLTLKYYGVYGEYRESHAFYYIPNEFLSPGEFKYTLFGGKTPGTNEYYFNGTTTIGLTSWLTTMSSAQYRKESKEYEWVNSTFLRLGGGFTLNVGATSKQFYASGLRYYNVGSGVYDLIGSFQNDNETLGIKRNIQVEFRGALPRIEGFPVNLSLNALHQQNSSKQVNTINTNMSLRFLGLSLSSNYIVNFVNDYKLGKQIIQNFRWGLGAYWSEKPSWLEFIGNTSLMLNANYNFDFNRVGYVGLSLNQSISNDFYLNFSSGYDLIKNQNSMNASINLTTSFLRSSTSARFADNEETYIQQMQGSVGFDPSLFKFNFDNKISYNKLSGESGASIRFYLDENMNGKYDKKEKVIPNVAINLEGPNRGSIEVTENGTFLKNLTPNIQYYATVNIRTIKNPLWQPYYLEFSFITDPNANKIINVPCYSSAIVEGKVTKFKDNTKIGQAGVKVHFVNKTNGEKFSIPVFTDGSFYNMGVKPGDYTVYVDSMQLAVLDLVSEPALRNINLRSTEIADMAEGLDFVLYAKVKESLLVFEKTNTENVKEGDSLVASIPKHEEDEALPKYKNQSDNIDHAKAESIQKQIVNTVTYNYYETKVLLFSSSVSTAVTPEMRDYLNALADFLLNSKKDISVVGHTDNAKDAPSNLQISLKRAEAIKNYLVAKGVEPNRILTRGQGALQPKESNTTPEGRRANRRVEIIVIN